MIKGKLDKTRKEVEKSQKGNKASVDPSTEDYEKLRGQMIRRLKTEIELLDEGLHALRLDEPKIHVMDDHAERAIGGLKKELERLKRDLIQVNCHVNIEKLGFKLFLLCLDARVKKEVINHIKCCPKIISYFNTYGEYNFIMLPVAENTETMESMIEHCLSFTCTDITKYTVIPIINASSMYQPIKFLSAVEKSMMKCDFKTDCPDCESFKKDMSVGCPLYEGYNGIV